MVIMASYTKKILVNLLDKLTPKKKGNMFEMDIKKLARKHKFKVVPNIYIGYKTYDHKQKYVEIDIALISKKGIIIVEAKNYTSTVSGKYSDIYLKSAYVNSYKTFTIYNPILQNESHVKRVSNYLNLDNLTSLIVFSDTTKLEIEGLKESNAHIINFKELSDYLIEFNKNPDIFSDAKYKSIINKLQKRNKVTPLVRKRHKKQVKKAKKY